jgi:hypothetical protein
VALKATIRRAVKSAFKAMDDIPKVCSYKSVAGAPTRDLDSGTSTRVTTNYTLPMVVFAKFSERQIDRDPALLTDMKMIFPSEDLPVEPKQSDTVVDDVGIIWTIVKRLSDPAAVVTILQVRTG